MKLHPVLEQVTGRIRERSAPRRCAYLRQIDQVAAPERGTGMGCANVAHVAGLPRENPWMPEELVRAKARGVSRELFSAFRRNALAAEEGACTWL